MPQGLSQRLRHPAYRIHALTTSATKYKKYKKWFLESCSEPAFDFACVWALGVRISTYRMFADVLALINPEIRFQTSLQMKGMIMARAMGMKIIRARRSQGLGPRQPQLCHHHRSAIIVLFGDRSITALPSSPLHADPSSPMPSTPASQSVQTTDDAPSSPLIGEPDKNDVVLPLEYRALTFLRSCKQKASHP